MQANQRIIIDMVQIGDRVLDLGCGDGGLLEHLQASKQVQGYGLDLDEKNITQCLAKGISVIEHDLNDGLEDFETKAFDAVIMAETLQVMKYPDLLLEQMLRVGRTCVVTLPNFGHYRCRRQLLSSGRMPVSRHLPNAWYETPNIHLCTFLDFEALCRKRQFNILERRIVDTNYQPSLMATIWPNLFGAFGLYRLQKG